jgi:cobalt/nickel transport system ATP-binding protein
MGTVIEVNHLSYVYPDGTQALDDINLTVMAGEKVAFIGGNGAGKSTLLLHLNGILSGTGRITVDGLAMKKDNLPRIRALVGMVFQNPDDQLFSSTVFEDVAYGPIYQGTERKELAGVVSGALAAVEMSGFEKRHPYHLSSGEKKRIAIATVLAMRPKLVVLDEPAAGLDPRAKRELVNLLRRMEQTVIIATHELDLVAALADRVVVMKSGKLVSEGSPDQILTDLDLLNACGLH